MELTDTQKSINRTAGKILKHASEAQKHLEAMHQLMSGDAAADRVESRYNAKTLAEHVNQYYYDVQDGYESYCHDVA